MNTRFVPLHEDFGAEVQGLSMLDVVTSRDAYEQAREAFETYSVLVWRGQDITPDIQTAFTRAFGPLEVTRTGLSKGSVFGVLSNMGPDGQLLPETGREALQARANQLWHVDSSFKEVPSLGSVLRACQVPPAGGETEFVSTRAAWERLGRDEQSLLRRMVTVHSWEASRSKITTQLPSEEEKKLLPPVRWRMTWDNPVNGRTALLLGAHIGHIEGMDLRESAQTLDDLTHRSTQPQHSYLHRWSDGDVVMWDNRATLHRGRPWEFNTARHMVRTTAGATMADGLASVTPPMP